MYRQTQKIHGWIVRIFLCVSFLTHVQSLWCYKVGLLVVATGRYIEFIPPLVASAKKYFLSNHDVTYFIYTDQPIVSALPLHIIPVKKYPWPYASLYRSKMHYENASHLAQMDYLFACDADMLFVDTVGDEILAPSVGTMSPGFVGKRGSYETNPLSTAYVAPHEGTTYFAGGFYGGSRELFLSISRYIIENSNTDDARGYIAVWHDESYLNRYFIDNPPTCILSAAYCYPDSKTINMLPGVFPDIAHPKLLALTKDHAAYRG